MDGPVGARTPSHWKLGAPERCPQLVTLRIGFEMPACSCSPVRMAATFVRVWLANPWRVAVLVAKGPLLPAVGVPGRALWTKCNAQPHATAGS